MGHAGLNRRGQPLIALCLVVVVWTGVRMVMWDGVAKTLRVAPAGRVMRPGFQEQGRGRGAMVLARPEVRSTTLGPEREHSGQRRSNGGDRADDVRLAEGEPAPTFLLTSLLRSTNPALATPPHRKRLPVVADTAQESAPRKDDPRWSGDNWLLLRAGSGVAAQAPGAASYGASQAGAVVRYRLGRGDLHESYGYLRTSLAINAPGRDKEVALGFGFRPLARVPLRVLAEARLQDTKGSPMQVRPVATVITELPPQALPLGLRAEAYAQGGYAGGRGATAFYDAQVMIDRAVPGIGGRNRDFRVGAGAWSGGQDGAVRLDIGPRASFRLDLGDATPARIALDWRFRVAGNARPGSGPALTVASSF
jgi:hypothetical protein